MSSYELPLTKTISVLTVPLWTGWGSQRSTR